MFIKEYEEIRKISPKFVFATFTPCFVAPQGVRGNFFKDIHGGLVGWIFLKNQVIP